MAMHERDPEQEQRIERLKAQAAAAAEGPMVAGESEDLPADVREEFWREVAAFETEGTTNLLTELKAIGVDPRHPDGLDDEESTPVCGRSARGSRGCARCSSARTA